MNISTFISLLLKDNEGYLCFDISRQGWIYYLEQPVLYKGYIRRSYKNQYIHDGINFSEFFNIEKLREPRVIKISTGEIIDLNLLEVFE